MTLAVSSARLWKEEKLAVSEGSGSGELGCSDEDR
jgi:hypothetical protein